LLEDGEKVDKILNYPLFGEFDMIHKYTSKSPGPNYQYWFL
jgi:hypothetical protein